MKRVTIKDIAKIAGVSYATISRALNNSPEISPETRARIQEICRQEGYRANSLARSLVSNKTGVLGLILPDISHPFYGEIALNIELCARKHHYNVMMCNSLHDVQQIGELLQFLVAHQVDGVIIASSHDDVYQYVTAHVQPVPVVLLGDCISSSCGAACNAVSLDNFTAGRIATEYLIGLGHRDIVYLGRRRNSTTHLHRCTGYEQTMQDHGLTPCVIDNMDKSSSLERGYALSKQVLISDQPCSAIFAATDSMALGVMKAADELQIRIPEELSLLGVDNYIYSALSRTMLTTIDQRKTQLAEASVGLLMDLLNEQNQDEYTHRVIRPTLVERSTCAPFDPEQTLRRSH